jgi:hypothetical protein
MKKTIAQELRVKDFPFEIRDGKGNLIYKEWNDGYWARWEYDDRGNQMYHENSKGLILKWTPEASTTSRTTSRTNDNRN